MSGFLGHKYMVLRVHELASCTEGIFLLPGVSSEHNLCLNVNPQYRPKVVHRHLSPSNHLQNGLA